MNSIYTISRVLSVALLVSLGSVADTQAQAWPHSAGGGFYQIGFQYIRASEFYEPDGHRIDITTIGDYLLSFYGEHGLTDRLTATAYIPFVERVTLNRVVGEDTGFEFFSGDEVVGPADWEIGARYGILKKGGTVASVFFRLGIPIGDSDQENGLQTGDGELNQIGGIAVGHSFWPKPTYAQADIGYNNRVKGYSDEILFKLEAGYTLQNVWTLAVKIRGLISTHNGVDERLGGTGGLYGNNQQFVSYGGEVSYVPKGTLGVSLRGEWAAVAENVLAAPAFGFSMFLKR